MNIQRRFKETALAILLTVTTHSSAWAVGPSNGGGGFQYPNSRALLKKVSTELARDIMGMDPKSFSHLPAGFSRNEVAQLIREVKYRPDLNRARTNPEGEEEGLMFDYSEQYCDDKAPDCSTGQNSIVAMEPFFDTYRALPMKQLAEIKFADAQYKLTEQDVRERLLHEVAHLLGIGKAKNGSDDANGDVFSKRVLKAADTQVVRCEAKIWVENPSITDNLLWYGFVIHRATGNLAVAYGSYGKNTRTYDRITGAMVPIPKPDIESKPAFYVDILNQIENSVLTTGVFNANPFQAFHTASPGQFDSDEAGIRWTAKTAGYFTPDSKDRLTVNLTTGEGTYEFAAKVFGEQGLLPPEQIKNVKVPLTCRASRNTIEVQDLLTR